MITNILLRALLICSMLFAGPLVLADSGQTEKTQIEIVQAETAQAVLAALALSDIIEQMCQEGLALPVDVTGGF